MGRGGWGGWRGGVVTQRLSRDWGKEVESVGDVGDVDFVVVDFVVVVVLLLLLY